MAADAASEVAAQVVHATCDDPAQPPCEQVAGPRRPSTAMNRPLRPPEPTFSPGHSPHPRGGGTGRRPKILPPKVQESQSSPLIAAVNSFSATVYDCIPRYTKQTFRICLVGAFIEQTQVHHDTEITTALGLITFHERGHCRSDSRARHGICHSPCPCCPVSPPR